MALSSCPRSLGRCIGIEPSFPSFNWRAWYRKPFLLLPHHQRKRNWCLHCVDGFKSGAPCPSPTGTTHCPCSQKGALGGEETSLVDRFEWNILDYGWALKPMTGVFIRERDWDSDSLCGNRYRGTDGRSIWRCRQNWEWCAQTKNYHEPSGGRILS